MLLHSRSIVFEVCLVLIATHGATSAANKDHSAEDEDYSEYGHDDPDYTKYFGAQIAASEAVANKQDVAFDSSFVYPEEYENFYFAPTPYDPKPKGSTASKSFAPQPIENEKKDPYDEEGDSFEEKEAASDNSPLEKDYFEESQKKQQAEESEIRPGPHYVSHQVPVPERYSSNKDDEEDEAQSKDDVETIPPPLKGRSKSKGGRNNPAGPTYTFSYEDAYDSARKPEEQIEQTKVDPATYYGGKNADYNTGKSSSTVSQYPAANGYLVNHKAPTTTSYGFQPATTNYEGSQSKHQDNFANTASPVKNSESSSLNQQEQHDGSVAPSEKSENLKKKACRKIIGPENAANMDCFVCEDAGNKAKYTQCSYASSEEPVNQYAGSAVTYSQVKAPTSYRYKRSPSKETYDEDPYYLISQRNRKYFEDFEKEQQAAESERQRDFYYKPHQSEYDESYSESQSSELLKQPGACQEVERDGSTCTVCKDPKTGGNFEQCSYTAAPKEHKYAYVAEKKYDSEDEPQESKIEIKKSSPDEPQKVSSSSPVAQSAAAPVEQFSTATKSKIIKDPIPELSAAGTSIDAREEKPLTEESEDADDDEETDSSEEQKKEKDAYGPYYYNYGTYGELKKNKKLVNDDPYNVPEHFAASVSQKNTAAEDDDEEENFDEYHYKLFPELNKEAESRNEEQRVDATEQKPHDVEEVLAEFAKKDRSNCKKAEKNGMTCFLCVDQNKVQHEECMYVAESKPRPTHIAYHEVQRLKDPKDEHHPLVDEQAEPEESKKVETITQQPLDHVLPSASEITKKKRFFKKVITTPLPLGNVELTAAASEVQRTVVPYERKSKSYRKETIKDSRGSGSAPDSERLVDESERLEDEPNQKQKKEGEEPETPKEIDVGDEEGAFSHETKPVYSKLFGTNLPKYMVEKTEFEKDFDAAAGFD